MGGASSTRKSKTGSGKRLEDTVLPYESPASFKLRSKFLQGRKCGLLIEDELAIWLDRGKPVELQAVIKTLQEQMNIIVSSDVLKTVFGVGPILSWEELSNVVLGLWYNPAIGGLYQALLNDREELTPDLWREFLSEFQGYPDECIEGANEEFITFGSRKAIPSDAGTFAEALLGPANCAFSPILGAMQRFDRPITEYFFSIAKVRHFDDCSSPLQKLKKLMDTVRNNAARVIEFECSGDSVEEADGVQAESKEEEEEEEEEDDTGSEPRVFGDIYPDGTPSSALPTLREALKMMLDAMEDVWLDTSGPHAPLCSQTGERLEGGPLFMLIISVNNKCSDATQRRIGAVIKQVLGSRIDCPPPNTDGTVWSPLQLAGKVLLVVSNKTTDSSSTTPPAPPARTSFSSDATNASQDSSASGKLRPVVQELLDMAHMHMLCVSDIRPILDQAKSRSELRQLLQRVVLTLTQAELCAHIMELTSITSMLMVHVQSKKRLVYEEKKANLLFANKGSEYVVHGGEEDKRTKVQFSELPLNDWNTCEARFETEKVLVETNESVDPLRGWRFGAQMVPADYGCADKDPSLHAMCLFKQHGGLGFVPRLPRDVFRSLPGYVDQYFGFPTEYATSLFVTVLSASRIPRLETIQEPFMRVHCNNGTGLKQIALTSTVRDNGFNCVWEEDFEFKLHVNDLGAAATLIFSIGDRDKVKGETTAFTFVPLWGLQTGYRSLPLFDANGAPVTGGSVLLHLDWEEFE